ncbi:glycosyl hydrolase family 61-domain-containing protein [Microdochium bolleyi]|uniref:lytic cellulose monooxygenase (C4-dehydrogenating) n=1 Tax=Microdochium bolleyi TaxID=196109 RepID=A0A136JCL8_9PEZI|nr:glycosyl hydrolase family 61-domain-containing protein [Microdochium bolleyi]
MPSVKSTLALAAAYGASSVLGHGLVRSFVVDGKFTPGFILDYYYAKQSSGKFPDVAGWYAENLDNGFVEPAAYSSPDIICHKKAAPGAASAPVAAGGTVEFQWDTWPQSHIGPIFTYAAACPGNDCTKVDKTALKWFKIDEAGFNVATQKWKTDDMIANNFTWSTTVPSNLKAGAYVLRHEIIAMHAAQQANGAQNYPQCMNVQVTGSGTVLPEGVAGTSLYTADHPGIKFNPYGNLASYEIPGPAVPAAFAKGGNTGGGNAGTPTTPAPVPTASSTKAPAPTVAVPSSTAAPSAVPTSTTPPPTTGNPGSGSGSDLPETFTLETFISWLQKTAGKKSSARRSHPRAMKI